MLIKQTTEMTKSERIAAENSNNQYLQAMSYVAVGTIFPFVGADVPETFMLCDGRELDINEYSELFSVIGYTFGGEGDTFNIPDLRGRTLVGRTVGVAGPLANIGNAGGSDTITIKDENLPNHYFFGTESGLGVVRGKVQSDNEGRYAFLGKEAATDAESSGIKYIFGGGEPLDNMPPYSTVDYIIKTMQGTAACEYDYAAAINTAVKQNFDEAVATGTIKGEKGDSGVYVGTEEPTDPEVMVWVNPEGIADEIPSGGSGTDGADGEDGFSPTVEVTENESGHTVSITDVNGTKTFDVLNGKDGEQGLQGEKGADGSDGADGKDGISVTHSWDGTVLTITSASGTSSADLKGEKGEQGEKGETGEKGDIGAQGPQGESGYTPQIGTDYWTEADKAQMVSDVIDALGGNPVFGVVNANNEIVINGNLSDGSYTVKYEAEDGSTTKIGELVVGDLATESILPMTWTASKTIDSSTGEEADYGDTMTVSDTISLTDGAIYTIKNVCTYTSGYYCKINSYWYDAAGTYMGRLEHNTELGCATDDYSIPNGAVANISTMEGAASVRFRLNHASGDTENAQNFIKFYITV